MPACRCKLKVCYSHSFVFYRDSNGLLSCFVTLLSKYLNFLKPGIKKWNKAIFTIGLNLHTVYLFWSDQKRDVLIDKRHVDDNILSPSFFESCMLFVTFPCPPHLPTSPTQCFMSIWTGPLIGCLLKNLDALTLLMGVWAGMFTVHTGL